MSRPKGLLALDTRKEQNGTVRQKLQGNTSAYDDFLKEEIRWEAPE
jgi:hypothetical protein